MTNEEYSALEQFEQLMAQLVKAMSYLEQFLVDVVVETIVASD